MWLCGGRGEIRTHGGLAPTAVFKTAALNHSATLPTIWYDYLFHQNRLADPVDCARCLGNACLWRLGWPSQSSPPQPPATRTPRDSRDPSSCCPPSVRGAPARYETDPRGSLVDRQRRAASTIALVALPLLALRLRRLRFADSRAVNGPAPAPTGRDAQCPILP